MRKHGPEKRRSELNLEKICKFFKETQTFVASTNLCAGINIASN